jgi:hypothetical protein
MALPTPTTVRERAHQDTIGPTASVRERAHQDAMRLPIANVADKLQRTLGQQLTAYAVGIRDPRAIGKYARNQRPRQETETRLRDLYVITQVLLTRETAETVRAWMMGAHPLLEGRAPVELLHEENAAPVDRTAAAETRAAVFRQMPRTSYQSVEDAAVSFVAAYA